MNHLSQRNGSSHKITVMKIMLGIFVVYHIIGYFQRQAALRRVDVDLDNMSQQEKTSAKEAARSKPGQSRASEDLKANLAQWKKQKQNPFRKIWKGIQFLFWPFY